MSHIRATLQCNDPILAVSPSFNQEFAAIACERHVEVIHLSPTGVVSTSKKSPAEKSTFRMSDVSWNQFGNGIIASSTNTGIVYVFNFEKSGEQPTEFVASNQGINKIYWHPTDRPMLCCAMQDGNVVMLDTKAKPQAAQSIVFTPQRQTPCKDIHIDPFNEHRFAALYSNGNIFVGDRRSTRHAQCTFAAHNNSGTSVTWSPSEPNILASSGTDKTVKIWSLDNPTDSNYATSYTPTHTFHCPNAVDNISWRGVGYGSHRSHLAWGSAEQGDIYIYSTSNTASPACILRAHSEAISGLFWLDTPFNSIDNIATKTEKLVRRKGKKMCVSMGVFQHIASIGKDRRVLVHDIRSAYYPMHHVNNGVVAFSSLGHVAYHRGHVDRSDVLGLVSNADTQQAPGWFADDPASFTYNVAQKYTAPASAPPEAAIGAVGLGYATLHSSFSFQKLVAGEGAEGGPFDPVIMCTLAEKYRCDQAYLCNDAAMSQCSLLEAAIKACQYNQRVVQVVGLDGHACLWSSLITLLPAVAAPPQAIDHTTGIECIETADSSGRLNIAWDILLDLLQELLEHGDVQHFVAFCEIIRCVNVELLTSIREKLGHRVKEAYSVYLDILSRLKLNALRNKIIKHSEDFAQKVVNVSTYCGKCGKNLTDDSMDRPAQNSPDASFCRHCKKYVGCCALCQKPVLGVYHMCTVCGHGGHVACMKKWFDSFVRCPTGCGHVCVPVAAEV